MRKLWLSFLILGFILILGACQDTNDNNTENSEDKDASENDNDSKTSGDTSEDDDIDGTLWDGDGDTGVVLSHGAAYDADSWDKQGKEFADNGMVAFATEDTDPEQLVAAANMLKDEHDVDEVALLGASAGGASGIDAITDGDFNFAKAAFLSPGGDASAIEDIPVLVIYSEEEGFDDLDGASVETHEIPGSAHAQEIFDEAEGDEVMDELVEFLKK